MPYTETPDLVSSNNAPRNIVAWQNIRGLLITFDKTKANLFVDTDKPTTVANIKNKTQWTTAITMPAGGFYFIGGANESNFTVNAEEQTSESANGQMQPLGKKPRIATMTWDNIAPEDLQNIAQLKQAGEIMYCAFVDSSGMVHTKEYVNPTTSILYETMVIFPDAVMTDAGYVPHKIKLTFQFAFGESLENIMATNISFSNSIV